MQKYATLHSAKIRNDDFMCNHVQKENLPFPADLSMAFVIVQDAGIVFLTRFFFGIEDLVF